MKHIKRVSGPKRADVWQDVVCTISSTIVGLLSFKNGNIPGLTWLDEKCQPSTILES